MPLQFFLAILESKYGYLNTGHMKIALQQFSFKTVLQLKPEECSRTQSTVTLQKLTHYMGHTNQNYVFLNLSLSTALIQKMDQISEIPASSQEMLLLLPVYLQGTQVLCQGWAAQGWPSCLSVCTQRWSSLYQFIMGRLWESHFQTRSALTGYAAPPRGTLRWGLDNAPTASNCKPKVKSAFLQIFRHICFQATLLLVNQFAKIFMNSKLQGHGYSKMLTCDNTTKYSMFAQHLACSRWNEKTPTYNND